MSNVTLLYDGVIKNPEAIAWTIAAEGYILLHKNHNSFQPRIGMANTDKEFIYKFQAMAGNTGHVYYYKDKNPKHRGKWFWELYSMGDCLEFLTEILDYLPIKHEQADIIIGYCIRALDKVAKTRGMFRGSPEWRLIWVPSQEDTDDFNKVKELNQRGIK